MVFEEDVGAALATEPVGWTVMQSILHVLQSILHVLQSILHVLQSILHVLHKLCGTKCFENLSLSMDSQEDAKSNLFLHFC